MATVALPVDVAALLEARNGGARRADSWPGDASCGRFGRALVDGKGYGLLASGAIARGELVCASRALGVVYEDELGLPEAQLRSLPTTQLLHAELARRLANALAEGAGVGREALLRRLFSLYDGTDGGYGLEVEGHRLGLGEDGTALLPKELKRELAERGTAEALSIDPQRIVGMLGKNSDDVWCFSSSSIAEKRQRVEGCAVFGEPSWINHSFDANVVVTTICDIVLLWATRDISEGEELSRSYATWDWDQESVGERLGRFGIDLGACVRESGRLLPPPAVGHARWAPLCRLLASAEREVYAGSRGGSLERMEEVLVRTLADFSELVASSPYIELRVRLLLADVQTRRRRLAAALYQAEKVVELARSSAAPAGEFSRYCVVLLLLAAGLYHAPPTDEAPARHGSWRRAAAALASTAAELAAAFLGRQRAAFVAWVRCWFGAVGPMEPLLAGLPPEEHQVQEVVNLQALD